MQKRNFPNLFILLGVVSLLLIFNIKIETAKAFFEFDDNKVPTCCVTDFFDATLCKDAKAKIFGYPNYAAIKADLNTSVLAKIDPFCYAQAGCFVKSGPICITPVCTSWTYSAWSVCYQSNQTRSVATSSPAGCTGNPPAPTLTQTCATSSCSFDDDCTNGYCNTSLDPDTCSTKQTDGAACTRPTQCTGNVCTSGKCASSCMFDNNCLSNQYCKTSVSPATCTVKQANNADCTAANQCSGKFCNSGKCASSPAVVCSPACDPLHYYCDTSSGMESCKVKLGNGATCAVSNQCDSGYCSGTKCAPTPANCSPACSATQYCVGTTCKPKQLEGQVCSNSIECVTNLCHIGACMTACTEDANCNIATQFCNFTASPKTCNTKKSETQPCTAANQCTGGACTDNKCRTKCNPGICNATQYCNATSTPNGCVPKKADGLVCATAVECTAGFCVNLKCASAATAPACSPACAADKYCVGTTCNDKKADGQACSDPSQCTGGACNDSLCASVATAISCPSYTKAEDCATQPLQCEWVSNACSAKPGYGQSCTGSPDNCKEGLCITYEGKFLCRKHCTGTDCPEGNFCFAAGEFCMAKLADGGDCTDGNACISGVCEASKCKGGTAPAGAGVEGGGTPVAPSGYPIPNFLGVDDPNLVIGRIIKYIIGFVGTIALVTFMYGGALWLISAGRMDYVTKGKNYMIWAAVGLAIVFGSYIIVGQIFAIFGQ